MLDLNDIPGFTEPSQLLTFQRIAKQISANSNVLEIGAAFGKSTSSWLTALNPMASLTIIDNFKLPDENVKEKMETDVYTDGEMSDTKKQLFEYYFKHGQYATFKYIINQHHNKHIIKEVFTMRSADYMCLNYANLFDLVYLDGNHTYENVMAELEYFKRSTLICGDDYSERHEPVKRAVHDFSKKYNKPLHLFEERVWLIGEFNG